MPAMKSMADIAAKYARVTPGRQADYTEGVTNPTRDWQAGSLAAEPAYNAGIQAALANKSFGKGVRKAGSGKWQRKAMEVGPGRWAQGVANAGPEYEAGYAPFGAAVAAVTLPPKGAKGDPRNIERVAIIAKVQHELKVKKGA